MDKEKAYPTAQMRYLASLQDADLIKDAIDVENQFINYLVNRDVPDLIVVDDAGFEVKRFEFDVDDMESLAAARTRIKRHEERLATVNQIIAEILEENPELVPETPEPVDYSIPGEDFDIWAEGYLASGDRGDATFMGTVKARTFDEAVRKLISQWPDDKSLFNLREDGIWTYWACKLFDNEQDARKSFG